MDKMLTIEQLDLPIQVEAQISDQTLHLQSITWKNQVYAVIGQGRQWSSSEGKHVLVELHDGSRMEVRCGQDFAWRLLRYWPPAITV